jgi:predicted phage tail protein
MDEFKAVMTEWLSLKHQLAAARKDMSVLNKREKELRAQVQEHMKEIDIDAVKVNQEKVSMRTKEVRGSITKQVIMSGLLAYFNGDETRAEQLYQIILDHAPVRERSTITVKKTA